VATPCVSLEELGYLDEKEEKDKKDEAMRKKLTKIAYKCQFACLAPELLIGI